ncbi:MAG: hypothetical protein HUJ70_13395 [Pseudobutyrivibrio sp.]|nr:hypothetical protein [Pseudobutyrivibrio sp.]
MQVEGIKITDYLKEKTEDSLFPKQMIRNTKNTSESKSTDAYTSNFTVDSNNYTKYGKEADDNKIMDSLVQSQLMDESTFANLNYVNGPVSGAVVDEASKDGHSPLDMDVHTVVTVVDKIKMSLAKAGKDISAMGGLSEEELAAMSASVSQALGMADKINDNMTSQQAAFLVKNELEPTIENIFNANMKVPDVETLPDAAMAENMSEEKAVKVVSELEGAIENLAKETGISDVKETCVEMLKTGVNLTAENLENFAEYTSFEKPSEEEIKEAINDALAEGKEAKEAYLIKGHSIMDKARNLVEEVNTIDESALKEVTERITLERIRLIMTKESAFTMIKNGIEVDTSDLTNLLEQLEATQNQLIEKLCAGATKEETQANVSLYIETMEVVSEVKGLPIDLVTRVPDLSEATLPQIKEAGISLAAEFARMEMTYEAVGTEVRRDLGDSINKAFQNVGDILEDLGFEAEDELAVKAVHALARNQMAINKESVTTMKSACEELSRTMKSLSPAVVSELIKRGENPLDLSLKELTAKANEIRLETGDTSEEEGFAKFLWKAEHTEGISEEQREAYIGVYRLLNQIEKSDGAAIGALMSQQTEVTLRNLMMAVRSGKKTGKEYEVSDKVGALDQLIVSDLSITQQVEKVFLTNRCRDAKEAMTPAKLMAFETEDAYLDMNPDQYASAMEAGAEDVLEEAYRRQQTAELRENFSNASEEVIRMLEQFDLPVTSNMISAMQQFMNSKNSVFSKLFEKQGRDEDEVEMLIENLTERFGEACKTPEEMAEAQEALGILAENAMKTMVNEEEVSTIDLKTMKLLKTQFGAMTAMAKNDETYHIPIMVANEAGNMTLKIVKGSYDKGLVKMAIRAVSTGAVSGSFRYEAGELNGSFTCEKEETREMMSEQAPLIAQTILEQTGLSVSLSFGRDAFLNENSIYDKADEKAYEKPETGDDTVPTATLYKAAKSLIDVVSEIFN